MSSLFEDPLFGRFCSERPIAVMGQLALSRLLDPKSVDEIFEQVSEVQYERTLMFSSLAEMMSAVVLSKQASVNAAYKKMKDELGVSLNAVYGKLDRVEPRISKALVRYAYQQVVAIRKEFRGTPQNDIPGYRTRILDGNHLGKTEHRLAETRNSTAAPLPGKSLVVLEPRYEAIADYFPIEDGHAQERSALDDVIETVRRNDLWVADRNFCTLKLMYEIDSRNAFFVIRHHEKLEGEGLGKRKRIGNSETGVVYERTMKISKYDGRRMTVRRIEVELKEPTRDSDYVLVILTNVPKEDADALKIAQIYRDRWKIETAFQVMTQSLRCEVNTLCYPKAALFAFSLACVAYNALALVRAAIAVERGRTEADLLSHYYLALEIAQTTDGMLIAIPVERWLEVSSLPLDEFTERMRDIARNIDLDVYRKAKRGPKKQKPKKKHKKNVVHVSTAKILAQRKEKSAC